MARVNDGTLDTRLGEEAIRSGNEKSQQLRGTRIQSGALKNKTGSFVDGQTSAPFRSFRDEDVSVFECQVRYRYCYVYCCEIWVVACTFWHIIPGYKLVDIVLDRGVCE